ncbi:hypothetical protein CLV78_108188 [Aliiruegeria haliotis]|uniref:Uncharacterized protein n=1 Tax=Aliiruegeria haliotis TaxID=1280846 RepID=A0A2T0RL44_9RHOB|nr:hypothetical protein [Aliiruegeria haliotis]PRY21915.1 hypothetical protein CLV78_108188 [Aliiruegeria haliotis]
MTLQDAAAFAPETQAWVSALRALAEGLPIAILITSFAERGRLSRARTALDGKPGHGTA